MFCLSYRRPPRPRQYLGIGYWRRSLAQVPQCLARNTIIDRNSRSVGHTHHNVSTRANKPLNDQVLSAYFSPVRSRLMSTSSNHPKCRRTYWSGQGTTRKPANGSRCGSPSPVA
jgi:hypothetical protein